jgi:hypothetical protein
MPTPTYDLIASTTLAASTSEVIFGSLPQTYRDFVVVFNGGVVGTSNVNIFVSFNGDTTNSNFSAVQMSGTGGVTDGTSIPSQLTRLLNYYGFPAENLNTNIITQVMDFSATDKHKTYLSRANNTDNGVTALAGRWANTSAITTVAISSQTGFMRTGTTISLYGIAS